MVYGELYDPRAFLLGETAKNTFHKQMEMHTLGGEHKNT